MLDNDFKNLLFGQIAMRYGFITAQQLHECLHAQNDHDAPLLGQILIEHGYLTSSQARQVGVSRELAAGRPVRLGRYEIIKKIGRGGMGNVYQARDLGSESSLAPLVAVKILPPLLARDEEFLARFQREGRLAGMLRHPNIVSGYDLDEVDGFHFIAMEYVAGETAWQLFQRQNLLDEGLVLQIGIDVCSALQHAASHGLVHRDIKPENIMIVPGGHAKLLDLGLARSFEQRGQDRPLTGHGLVVGTPQYLSPEQARGDANIDARSDLYSLGATLYHLVTGREPFPGTVVAVVLSRHLYDPVQWPADIQPSVSEGLCRVLVKLLAKDKRHRYQTPELAAEDFVRLQQGQELPAWPEKAPYFVRGKRAADSEQEPRDTDPQDSGAADERRETRLLRIAL